MKSNNPGKKEMTNRHIIEKAAELFNRKGYAGTSISDIMEATGLEKGGIYSHFKSKKEISVAAFKFNADSVFRSFDVHQLSGKSAVEKLHIIFDYIERMYDEPYLSGGCPLLNTATEADDTDAELLSMVREYLNKLINVICEIVKDGIEDREVSPDVDPHELAVACINILEGGNFLVKVYNDKSYRRKAIKTIKALIYSELRG